ncbi:MAG: hypothetical protein AAFZ63_25275, partial [Bacteroidota bacterium]
MVVGSQDPQYAMVQVYGKQDGEWQLKGEPIKSKAYGDIPLTKWFSCAAPAGWASPNDFTRVY